MSMALLAFTTFTSPAASRLARSVTFKTAFFEVAEHVPFEQTTLLVAFVEMLSAACAAPPMLSARVNAGIAIARMPNSAEKILRRIGQCSGAVATRVHERLQKEQKGENRKSLASNPESNQGVAGAGFWGRHGAHSWYIW